MSSYRPWRLAGSHVKSCNCQAICPCRMIDAGREAEIWRGRLGDSVSAFSHGLEGEPSRCHTAFDPAPAAVAAVLVAAGIYELSPLKSVCLRRCRSPLAFLLQHWKADDSQRSSLA